MKIALIYDRVNKIGGAERVVEALHEIWPQAPLYTAVYDKKSASWAKGFVVIVSFLQKIPFAKTAHELLPWLTPLAFKSFDLSKFEVVISVTSAEAKFVKTNPRQLHVCYCLTPTRYLWSGFWDYLKNPGFGVFNWLARAIFWLWAPILRMWDFSGSRKIDQFLAISTEVKKRIRKYYRRESEVIYPSAGFDKFKIQKSKCKITNKSSKFFLVVSRLVPYKNIDLIVKAFNKTKLKLKIIGIGNQLNYLKKIANSNVEFLGQVSDEQLLIYYADCQALVMAAVEDFGLTAVEVQFAGRPVIAYRGGGALDSVVEGKTGLLYDDLSEESLRLALIRFESIKFKPLDCRQNAEKFSKNRFKNKFKKLTEEKWQEHQQKPKQ